MKIQKSFAENHETGTLYVVATPIGNLQDLSQRALDSLQQVDWIAAEDTRQTRKLLSHFHLSTPLLSYHEHNRAKRDFELLSRLQQGESIALVSDAGLPSISDPGESLVRIAIETEIPVVPIPGANAALSALVASGLPPQPFLFLGFLPRQRKARQDELARWVPFSSTIICYESPYRLKNLLQDMVEVLGNRRLAIARELTKKHEEWIRGTVEECLQVIEEKGTRGEYTIVVEGGDNNHSKEKKDANWTLLSIHQHVEQYLKKGMEKKEAIKQVALERSLPKREVYNTYHQKK